MVRAYLCKAHSFGLIILTLQGTKDYSLSSPEAIELLSFLCAAQEPAHHRSVQRALTVYGLREGNADLSVLDLPSADVIESYIRSNEEDAIWESHRAAFSEVQLSFAHILRFIAMQESEVSNRGNRLSTAR